MINYNFLECSMNNNNKENIRAQLSHMEFNLKLIKPGKHR